MFSAFPEEVSLLIPVLRENVRIIEEPQGAVLVLDEMKNGRFHLISSLEAFIISLFDGTLSIRDISSLLEGLKNSPDQKTIESDIYSFVQQQSAFVEVIRIPLKERRIKEEPLKFLRKPNLFSTPIRPKQPLWADLYVTRECNLKCIYCFANAKYVGSSKVENRFNIHSDMLNKIIDQLSELGIKRILLTGGEPTLLQYLPYIVKQLTNNGIKAILATNACLMNNNLAQELRDSGLEHVQAKLDATNPKIQDTLSGINGSFISLMSGIEILKKHSFDLSVACVATSLNIEEIPRVIKLCVDLGVDEVSPRFYTPGIWSSYGRGGAYLNPQPMAMLSLEKEVSNLRTKYEEIIKISPLDSSHFIKKSEKNIPRCTGFISSCTILENGYVVPCETLSDFSDDFIMGNINNERLTDIWNSKRADKWISRQRPKIEEPCPSCDEFDRCKGGCAWKSYVAYGKWTADPFCVRAPIPTKVRFPEILVEPSQ